MKIYVLVDEYPETNILIVSTNLNKVYETADNQRLLSEEYEEDYYLKLTIWENGKCIKIHQHNDILKRNIY